MLALATHIKGVDLEDCPIGTVRDLTLVEQSLRFGNPGFPERDPADGLYFKGCPWHSSSPLHLRKLNYSTDARGREAVARENMERITPAVSGVPDTACVQEFLKKCGVMTNQARTEHPCNFMLSHGPACGWLSLI